MLRNKKNKSFFPKGFLFRLTSINTIVITAFVILSGWAIYNTACQLADGLISKDNQSQTLFESTLFQYLWIFIISAIVIGSLIHFYLTKKLIRPLRELIHSTKLMQQGEYPQPIDIKSEDEIGLLSNHFNALVKQLKDNHHYKQKLVSDLSHEFRTPLANISGYLHALKSGVMEGDPHLYESLYQESKRLNKLVEQMDQLKEWDYVSQQTFSEKESVEMKKLVEQIVAMFDWTSKKKNIEVNVEIQPEIVQAHRDGITQVISNVMDNAIQYHQGTTPIKIIGETTESNYLFSIIGAGQSIPMEAQDRIFERFYRVEHSRNRDTGGSGLGLAISKEIIEQHNGKIGVESEGDVHTFWFLLPL